LDKDTHSIRKTIIRPKTGLVCKLVICYNAETDEGIITQIRNKYKSVSLLFDERTKRLWAAAEAHELGWSGITAVHEAAGIHRQSIRNGIQELQCIESVDGNRCRKPGGGRKTNSSKDKTLLSALKVFVESTTMGDPMKPLL
jgi:hypothetical protein